MPRSAGGVPAAAGQEEGQGLPLAECDPAPARGPTGAPAEAHPHAQGPHSEYALGRVLLLDTSISASSKGVESPVPRRTPVRWLRFLEDWSWGGASRPPPQIPVSPRLPPALPLAQTSMSTSFMVGSLLCLSVHLSAGLGTQGAFGEGSREETADCR